MSYRQLTLNCSVLLPVPICSTPSVSQSQSYVTTDGQSARLSSCQAPSGAYDQICITVRQLGFVNVGRSLWRRTGLPFTIAAGPRQYSHSRVRVPGNSWPNFTVTDSKLPQPGGPGPSIYIPREQGGPVIKSKSHCDWWPVSQSWFRAPAVCQSRSFLRGAPSLIRGLVYLLSESLSAVISYLSYCKRYLQFARYTW
jgi:hypothetical protein